MSAISRPLHPAPCTLHGEGGGGKADYVPLAVLGLATGIAAGVALTTASFWLVRALQAGVPPSDTPDLGSPPAFVFLVGSLGGVLLAAAVTWRLLSPIGSTYRQGGLSMVAAFGTIALVTILAAPIDRLVGRWGVLGISLVAAMAALALRRAAGRAKARAA